MSTSLIKPVVFDSVSTPRWNVPMTDDFWLYLDWTPNWRSSSVFPARQPVYTFSPRWHWGLTFLNSCSWQSILSDVKNLDGMLGNWKNRMATVWCHQHMIQWLFFSIHFFFTIRIEIKTGVGYQAYRMFALIVWQRSLTVRSRCGVVGFKNMTSY